MIKQGLPIVKKHKVVVLTITYNHSKYIEDTLRGFAMQQTDFPFLCCVFDDASTDGEQQILKRWVENHCNSGEVEVYDHPITTILKAPDKNNTNCVYVIHLQKINTWGKPEKKDLLNYWREQGEYIALCEGDDYWIDPLKLQKQVDFLDINPDYSFCCHRFMIYKQDSGEWQREYADEFYNEGHDLEITLDLFFKTWVTQPLTTVYRLEAFELIQSEVLSYNYSRDVHLFYYLLKVGRGFSLNEKMGVYRWHEGGIASSLSIVDKLNTAVNIYRELYLRTNDEKVLEMYLANGINLIKNSNLSIEIFSLFKELWPYTKDSREKFLLLLVLLFPPQMVKLISFIRTFLSQK